MKICEVTGWLEERYPCAYAEEWDNVGLLVGDDEREVSKIFLALDLTEETLEQAIDFGAELIVTHHPMIFSGVKKINNHSFIGRRILKLVSNGIAYYAMHTNYDILGMAKLSADYLMLQGQKVLAVTAEREGRQEGLGRVGLLPREMTLGELAGLVKERLELPDVKVYGELGKKVKTAAVCTGSGKSLIPDVLKAKAQVYVTGDIDHHTGIDAVADGLSIIDAGHYGTEYIFAKAMKEELRQQFGQLEIEQARTKFPYTCI